MTIMYDVIVVGGYSADLIFSGMQEFPQLGKDVVSRRFAMTPGEAYIAAVSLHRLGIKVGWATDFGNDDFSRLVLKFAQEEGLDGSLFVMHDRPLRRISVAASYPGERAFLTYYDPDPQTPAAIPALVKFHAKVLLIPGLYYGPLLDTAITMIRAKKMKIVMDGNSSNGSITGKTRACRAIRKAIKNVDIFLPNMQEAKRLTGESDVQNAMRRLGDLCPLVVVKDGENGSYALTNHEIVHTQGIVINAIDTTGAGDNFNAGFVRAWLDGRSIETCLKWGNIVGGLSTTELGGTTRKITVDDVMKAINKYY